MFGFGKKKKLQEAKKFADELGQAVASDIDTFIRDQVIPTREAYLSVMVENFRV